MDTFRPRVPWLFSGILKQQLPCRAPSERIPPRKDRWGSNRVSNSLTSLRVFSHEPKARVCRGLRAARSCRGTRTHLLFVSVDSVHILSVCELKPLLIANGINL